MAPIATLGSSRANRPDCCKKATLNVGKIQHPLSQAVEFNTVEICLPGPCRRFMSTDSFRARLATPGNIHDALAVYKPRFSISRHCPGDSCDCQWVRGNASNRPDGRTFFLARRGSNANGCCGWYDLRGSSGSADVCSSSFWKHRRTAHLRATCNPHFAGWNPAPNQPVCDGSGRQPSGGARFNDGWSGGCWRWGSSGRHATDGVHPCVAGTGFWRR